MRIFRKGLACLFLGTVDPCSLSTCSHMSWKPKRLQCSTPCDRSQASLLACQLAFFVPQGSRSRLLFWEGESARGRPRTFACVGRKGSTAPGLMPVTHPETLTERPVAQRSGGNDTFRAAWFFVISTRRRIQETISTRYESTSCDCVSVFTR